MSDSRTYKIKPHIIDAAIYITVVDNDHGFPFKLLVNSKDMASFAWIEVTRLTLNALLKQKDFPAEVIDTLCDIQDSGGGYFYKTEQIPSIPAHIARVLRKDCIKKGIMVDGSD